MKEGIAQQATRGKAQRHAKVVLMRRCVLHPKEEQQKKGRQRDQQRGGVRQGVRLGDSLLQTNKIQLSPGNLDDDDDFSRFSTYPLLQRRQHCLVVHWRSL